MTERLAFLWPEIALFITTCIVMVLGLSKSAAIRKGCIVIAALGLLAAMALAIDTAKPATGVLFPHLMPFAKAMIAGVGLLILLVQAGTVDRQDEADIARGTRAFDPLRSNRAEYYSVFLFSLTGVMLCASAPDLIWLFLALELTSLPTYIMVTISGCGRDASLRSQEAGVKYFFLGAMGAATFLFGFTLLYGGTGHTHLVAIADTLAHDGINTIALAGILLSLIGIAFKIAAVPMHFYTPDVYQGAAAPVAAFLAFAPKTAGFLAIIHIAGAVGWTHGAGGSLPEVVRVTLWVMAALTMTVGNVLALLQSSVKRILAYSSIAHSGYMLVGVIAGPGDGSFAKSGLSAVLFYLLVYGVSNLGAFAVLACLERRNADGSTREIDSVEDLRGLCKTNPILGWTMVLSALSLLGMPPIIGFFAKIPLFTSAISAGEIPLVIVLGLNSAIAAFYYLRLVGAPMLADPDPRAEPAELAPFPSRKFAGLISAIAVIALLLVADALMDQTQKAARPGPAVQPTHAELPEAAIETSAPEHTAAR